MSGTLWIVSSGGASIERIDRTQTRGSLRGGAVCCTDSSVSDSAFCSSSMNALGLNAPGP